MSAITTHSRGRPGVWTAKVAGCGQRRIEIVASMLDQSRPGTARYARLKRILYGLIYGASIRTLARR